MGQMTQPTVTKHRS